MLKSFQKQLQGRHRQRYLETDTFIRGLIFFEDGHFIGSSMNRKQCAGVVFGALGTAYLHYSQMVSLSVYTIFSLQMRV